MTGFRYQRCDCVMVGSGTDTYDPTCDLPVGHKGVCKSTAAVDQHKISGEELRAALTGAFIDTTLFDLGAT